ncbi:MAG: MurR/RpiR family transcriptional regulator [Victivallales bacterium]|nr:MurR/RpiR family transcriptional regulator [Victivallales bacterium]
MEEKLFELLKEKNDIFTPNQKKIADYLYKNPDKASFMTITGLSNVTSVSESTITRFCSALGFKKYSQLQKELQKLFQLKLSSVDRFKLIDRSESSNQKEKIKKIFEEDVNIINRLYETLNIKTFNLIVSLLSQKNKVLITGCEASACLAEYLACNLRKIRKNVFLVTEINDKIYNQYGIYKENAVVLAFAFPRYPRKIIEFTEFLHTRKTAVIGITDGITSPLTNKCDSVVVVPIGKTAFIDPYAAVFTLLNAISIEVARKNPSKTQDSLEDFEKISEQNSTFIGL